MFSYYNQRYYKPQGKSSAGLVLGILLILAAVAAGFMFWQYGMTPLNKIKSYVPEQLITFPTGDKLHFSMQPIQPTLLNSQTGSDTIQNPQEPQGTSLVAGQQNTSNTTKSKTPTSNVAINDLSFQQGIATTNKISAVTANPVITIGNIVDIKGQLEIVDPKTVNSTNPTMIEPPYNYVLQITCLGDCSNTAELPTSHDTTTTIGTFEYKWATSTVSTQAGDYVAKMFIRSQVLDPNGHPYELEADFPFKLVT